jgi:hypothetical protein
MSNPDIVRILKNHEQDAATTVLAAISKEREGEGGKYLEEAEEAKRGEDDYSALSFGWTKHTYDPKDEARLWRDSLRIVGVSDYASSYI